MANLFDCGDPYQILSSIYVSKFIITKAANTGGR